MVTVFGGSGFLGRAIVAQLAAAGQTVQIAVRHPPKLDTLLPRGKSAQVSVIAADVRDRSSVAVAVRGADAVVNAVSLYVERGDDTFEAIHVRGAGNVALASARAGVKGLVHISGIGVDPASDSTYVRARAKGEASVREAFATADILRPSAIIGPGDALLRSLAAMVRALRVIPLFGRGLTRLQPVFVEDVARAVLSILSRLPTAGMVYELGGPKVYSYRDLLLLVMTHLKKRRLLLPVPFAFWAFLARVLSFVMAEPPLTYDQVVLMRRDNVVTGDVLTLKDLGIEARAVESVLRNCIG